MSPVGEGTTGNSDDDSMSATAHGNKPMRSPTQKVWATKRQATQRTEWEELVQVGGEEAAEAPEPRRRLPPEHETVAGDAASAVAAVVGGAGVQRASGGGVRRRHHVERPRLLAPLHQLHYLPFLGCCLHGTL
jgi:hypothetical protein